MLKAKHKTTTTDKTIHETRNNNTHIQKKQKHKNTHKNKQTKNVHIKHAQQQLTQNKQRHIQ